MIAQDVLDRALILMDATSQAGNIDPLRTQDYTQKAPQIIDTIQHEVAYKLEVDVNLITDLDDTLDLEDYICINVLPYGLAAILTLGDGDYTLHRYLSDKYEYNKSNLRRSEGQVTDQYNTLDGLREV